jgi:hypothetical protein
MKTILKISIFPALLLALAPAAYADSITLASYGTGDSSYGANNSALVYAGFNDNAPPALPVLPVPPTTTTYDLDLTLGIGFQSLWSGPISNSSWVSINTGDVYDGSNVEPYGYYTYTSTFEVAENNTYSGTISVYADDTAAVFLNGVPIVPFDTNVHNGPCAQDHDGPTCVGNPWTVEFSADLTADATNTLTVVDWQSGGSSAGVDFEGSLTAAPEPSSLSLFGAGLLGLAFMALRKTKHLGTVLHS